MRDRSKFGLGLAVLAACVAIAPATPASGEIVLHRDPSAAVPFVAHVGGSERGPTLRRDGSAAVPFVAQVGPDRASDGFDWGDAALGALAGGLLVLLGSRAAQLGRRAARLGAAGQAGGAQRAR